MFTLRMEPYAMIRVSFHNKPVKQWYCYNRIELWLQISSQAISVCFDRTTSSHSWNPEVQRNPG